MEKPCITIASSRLPAAVHELSWSSTGDKIVMCRSGNETRTISSNGSTIPSSKPGLDTCLLAVHVCRGYISLQQSWKEFATSGSPMHKCLRTIHQRTMPLLKHGMRFQQHILGITPHSAPQHVCTSSRLIRQYESLSRCSNSSSCVRGKRSAMHSLS